MLDYDYYFRLTDMLLAGDFASALMLFDEILSKGFDALHFISGLSSHLRDLIVCRNSSSRSLLELAPTIAARYDEYGGRCSMEFLYKALEISTATETAYKASGNPRLLIEFALIRMSRLSAVAQEVDQAPTVASAPAVSPAPVQPVAHQPAPPAPSAQQTAPAPQPVTAEQPAPAPQPVMAAQPAPEAPKPARSSGTSIKAMMSKVNAVAQAPAAKQAEEELSAQAPRTVSQEAFEGAWQKFLASVDKPKLKAALSANTPVFSSEENTVTQFVASELQKSWIVEKQLHTLQASLQNALGSKVRLQIEVKPQEEVAAESTPYMPTEMAKAMMDESQEVTDFTREFELEVK